MILAGCNLGANDTCWMQPSGVLQKHWVDATHTVLPIVLVDANLEGLCQQVLGDAVSVSLPATLGGCNPGVLPMALGGCKLKVFLPKALGGST